MQSFAKFSRFNKKKKNLYLAASFSVGHLRWVNQCWSYLKNLTLISSGFGFLKKKSSGTTHSVGFYVKVLRKCDLSLSELTLK